MSWTCASACVRPASFHERSSCYHTASMFLPEEIIATCVVLGYAGCLLTYGTYESRNFLTSEGTGWERLVPNVLPIAPQASFVLKNNYLRCRVYIFAELPFGQLLPSIVSKCCAEHCFTLWVAQWVLTCIQAPTTNGSAEDAFAPFHCNQSVILFTSFDDSLVSDIREPCNRCSSIFVCYLVLSP